MGIYRGDKSGNTDGKAVKGRNCLKKAVIFLVLLMAVSVSLLACGSSKNSQVSDDNLKKGTEDAVEAAAPEKESVSKTQGTDKKSTEEQSETTKIHQTKPVTDQTRQTESATEKNSQSEAVTEQQTLGNADFQFEDTGDTKYAYLTFDDGPSENTYPILDILDQYNVKATFFMVSKEDEASVQRCRAIAERGHALGMHSHTHVYSELYADMDSFQADVQGIHDWLYRATGQDVRLYRFPGGSSNTVSKVEMSTLIDYVTSMGYLYYDWNVSSGDASSQPVSAEQMIENIKSQSEGYTRVMVLMHDTNVKTETVRALPGIIEALQSAGYQIVPIKNNTRPIQHVKAGYMMQPIEN